MIGRILYGAAALIAVALFGLALFAMPPKVKAEPVSKSDWYKSLRQPGTGASCCDVSDCAPTRASYHDGQWWVPFGDRSLPVPPHLILDREPYDGISAYACIVGGNVYCFIKPGSGG